MALSTTARAKLAYLFGFSLDEQNAAKELADAVDNAGLASSDAYTPATPSNWPVVPTTVGGALDSAAPKVVRPIILDSTASGAGTTQTLTVTGLLSTDTILAVSMKTAGSAPAALAAFGSPGSGTLSVTFTADPTSGAIVRVLVQR